MRILLAEDEEPVIDSMKMLMGYWNHELDVVLNGGAALERIKKDIYDLVITDIQMPVMDGYELTRRIRSLGMASYQPIMVISATESSEKSIEAGADDFLEKPYDCDVLQKKIYEMTPKIVSIGLENGQLNIEKRMPADKSEFDKLRELRKKGLSFFRLLQTGVVLITSENAKFHTADEFQSIPLNLSIGL